MIIMMKQSMRMGLLAILALAGGCATAISPPPPVETPSVVKPINKAKEAATQMKESSQQLEQLNPESQPSPSTTP